MHHSALAVTISLYGHLLEDSADEAVTALCAALDQADSEAVHRATLRAAQASDRQRD